MAPKSIERASRDTYLPPSWAAVRANVASAIEGAAPKRPANPLGLSTSAIVAKRDTPAPPTRKRPSHSICTPLFENYNNYPAMFGSEICRCMPIPSCNECRYLVHMAKKRQKQGGMVDPAKLGAVDKHDDKLLVVIIETPKGSRNKYAYDVK